MKNRFFRIKIPAELRRAVFFENLKEYHRHRFIDNGTPLWDTPRCFKNCLVLILRHLGCV
jgi:hypothetical protein